MSEDDNNCGHVFLWRREVGVAELESESDILKEYDGPLVVFDKDVSEGDVSWSIRGPVEPHILEQCKECGEYRLRTLGDVVRSSHSDVAGYIIK